MIARIKQSWAQRRAAIDLNRRLAARKAIRLATGPRVSAGISAARKAQWRRDPLRGEA